LELNDELLSAYLDGALDTHTLGRVESALERDPGARVRLSHMRAADERLRRAFALRSPAHDDPIVAHIQTGAPLPALPNKSRSHRVAWWSVAAAGIFGVALGFYIAALDRPASAPLARNDGVLNPVIVTSLNSVASGDTFERYEQSAAIVFSFQAADGRYCRVFKWRAAGQGAEGLACRETGDGTAQTSWQLIAWDAAAGTHKSSFQTAGASDLIDGAIDQLGGGEALRVEQERALIESDWHAAR
jgi:hypothetical protein